MGRRKTASCLLYELAITLSLPSGIFLPSFSQSLYRSVPISTFSAISIGSKPASSLAHEGFVDLYLFLLCSLITN